jgi:hypothetical protein
VFDHLVSHEGENIAARFPEADRAWTGIHNLPDGDFRVNATQEPTSQITIGHSVDQLALRVDHKAYLDPLGGEAFDQGMDRRVRTDEALRQQGLWRRDRLENRFGQFIGGA